ELVPRFHFQPDSPGWQFMDHDFTDLSRPGGAVLVGGYGRPSEANEAFLPVMIYWDGDSGDYKIEGLQDHPPNLSRGLKPTDPASTYLRVLRERVDLSDGGTTLRGYRVQDFGVTHDPDRVVTALPIDVPTASDAGRVEIRG